MNTMTYFVGTKYVTQQTLVKLNFATFKFVCLLVYEAALFMLLFVTLDNEIQWCKDPKKYLETSVAHLG